MTWTFVAVSWMIHWHTVYSTILRTTSSSNEKSIEFLLYIYGISDYGVPKKITYNLYW